MNKIDSKKLPRYVVDKRKRDQCDKDLRRTVTIVQEAVFGLAKETDVVIPTSADIQAWNGVATNADKRLEKAKETIMVDDSLTDSEKLQRIGAWKGWHKRVTTFVTHIVRNMQAYPQAQWQFDPNLQTIIPTADLSSVVDVAATVEVPQEAAEHAFLLSLVWDAVQGLRRWEGEHSVDKRRLEELFSFNEQRFAEAWAIGEFKHDPLFDTPQTVVMREYSKTHIV